MYSCDNDLTLWSLQSCVYVLGPADLAAIPDFQSGAMENWGLTTYRETGLLFDPDRSSASDKLGITKVIAHELAHQVGDLSVMVLPAVFEYWRLMCIMVPVVWKPGDYGVVE